MSIENEGKATEIPEPPASLKRQANIGLAVMVAAVAVVYMLFIRPTYEELLEAERSADASLSICQRVQPDCTRERAALEKAHQRVLDRTP